MHFAVIYNLAIIICILQLFIIANTYNTYFAMRDSLAPFTVEFVDVDLFFHHPFWCPKLSGFLGQVKQAEYTMQTKQTIM